jgi:putative aldouronate transport system substrate-binding protein
MANIAEGYFANIYDYKDYAPNYLYAIKSLSEKDANVKDATFYKSRYHFEFLSLYDEGLPSLAIVGIPNDWIKELGKSINDIVTTDDLHEVLYAFKSQFGCDYPWWMNDSIDNGGWFACYDVKTTLDNVYAVYYPGAIVVDGKVQFYYSNDNARNFVTMINQWISEGLVDPNWMNPSGPSSDLLATEDLGTFPSVAASLSYLKTKPPTLTQTGSSCAGRFFMTAKFCT